MFSLRVGDLTITHSTSLQAYLPKFKEVTDHRKVDKVVIEQKQKILQHLSGPLAEEVKLVLPAMLMSLVDEALRQVKEASPTKCPHCGHRWQGFYRPHQTGCPRA
jgi:hypothetical protein